MDRPQLFQRTLESLLANDLADWRFVIRIEPGPQAPDFLAIVDNVLASFERDVAVNDTVLGVRHNPFSAIDRAFAGGSPLNLCLEEDFVLSPDAIALALWYERHHRPHWLCLSLLAGPCASAGLLSNERYPEILFEARTFNSIGFALRREEWERHGRRAWAAHGAGKRQGSILDWRDHWGWDWSVYAELLLNPHLRTVQPVLARATHTGVIGRHATPEFHMRAFAKLPINLAGDVAYRLADVEALPHEIRSHIHAHEEMSDMRLALYEQALAEQTSRGKAKDRIG